MTPKSSPRRSARSGRVKENAGRSLDYTRYVGRLAARGWSLRFPGTHGCWTIASHPSKPGVVLKICGDRAWEEWAMYCMQQYREHGYTYRTRGLLRVYSLRKFSCGAVVAVLEALEEQPHQDAGGLPNDLWWWCEEGVFRKRLIAQRPRYWDHLIKYLDNTEYDPDLHRGNFMLRRLPSGRTHLVCIDPAVEMESSS